jgi:photosystem II stability/assembly factor-like uncharacterized protein
MIHSTSPTRSSRAILTSLTLALPLSAAALAQTATSTTPPTTPTTAPAAATPANPTIPDTLKPWLGRWKGDVQVLGIPGDAPKFTMELAIAPTSDPSRITWTIIYDGAAGKQERPYELLLKDPARGIYSIDEKNGILIDARLVANTFYTSFLVSGNRLTTREELLDPGTPNERITFELLSLDENSATVSGGKDDIPEVRSLMTQTVQRATLRRIDGNPQPAASSPLSANEKPQATPKEASGRAALPASPTEWTKQTTETYPGKQDDIFFINPTTGWYVNGAGKIFKTTDGGTTWVQKLHKPGTYFRCIAFVNDKIGLAGNIGPGYFPNVTDEVPLYRTEDGGETWSPVTTIEGDPVVGLCAIEVVQTPFVNAGNLDTKSRIVAVGRVGGPAAFIFSDDLGKTWQQLVLPKDYAMAFDVHFFDNSHGILATASSANVAESNARIAATDDGGKTWRTVYTSDRPYELTWKISFPSRYTGYVTIQNYDPDPAASERFVAKTTDGGKTWTELPLVNDSKVRQFGVAFISEDRGWIGAMPGGFETTDGGKTWQRADFGNAVNKIRVIRSPEATFLAAIGVQVHKLELPGAPDKGR